MINMISCWNISPKVSMLIWLSTIKLVMNKDQMNNVVTECHRLLCVVK